MAGVGQEDTNCAGSAGGSSLTPRHSCCSGELPGIKFRANETQMPSYNDIRRELLKVGGIGLPASAPFDAYAAVKNGAVAADGSYRLHNRFSMFASMAQKSDDRIYDTVGFSTAIDASADAGGGTVYVPAGTYLCYCIHLRSNVGFHLAQGSVIVAAETPVEGACSGPITGYNLRELCALVQNQATVRRVGYAYDPLVKSQE